MTTLAVGFRAGCCSGDMGTSPPDSMVGLISVTAGRPAVVGAAAPGAGLEADRAGGSIREKEGDWTGPVAAELAGVGDTGGADVPVGANPGSRGLSARAPAGASSPPFESGGPGGRRSSWTRAVGVAVVVGIGGKATGAGDAARVAVGCGVDRATGDGPGAADWVGDAVGERLGVGVRVGDGVRVGRRVGVLVGVGVRVGVAVGVGVIGGVGVGVAVGMGEGGGGEVGGGVLGDGGSGASSLPPGPEAPPATGAAGGGVASSVKLRASKKAVALPPEAGARMTFTRAIMAAEGASTFPVLTHR